MNPDYAYTAAYGWAIKYEEAMEETKRLRALIQIPDAVIENCLVSPGDKLLIAITFPAELDESESCHPDIVLEDFLASRNDGSWEVEIHSVLPHAERKKPEGETNL